MTMRILAISGSLRAASHNTALLREAAALAPSGVEVDLFEGLDRLPPYNEDTDTDAPPAEVARLRAEIAAADALLISTPEYNGTVPGQLKHMVDWASRPYGRASSLFGKPVAVLGASVTDYGAMWAQEHLRKALGIAGARVLPSELAVARVAGRFDSARALTDEDTREQLAELVRALGAHHRALAAAA
jgi:chromate reductase